jgi:hypothetical protein
MLGAVQIRRSMIANFCGRLHVQHRSRSPL